MRSRRTLVIAEFGSVVVEDEAKALQMIDTAVSDETKTGRAATAKRSEEASPFAR